MSLNDVYTFLSMKGSVTKSNFVGVTSHYILGIVSNFEKFWYEVPKMNISIKDFYIETQFIVDSITI